VALEAAGAALAVRRARGWQQTPRRIRGRPDRRQCPGGRAVEQEKGWLERPSTSRAIPNTSCRRCWEGSA